MWSPSIASLQRCVHGTLGPLSKPSSSLWHQYKRLIAPKGAHLLLFIQQILVPSDAAGALGAHGLLITKNHSHSHSLPAANQTCMVFLGCLSI